MLHPLARESLLEKQGIAEADVRVSAVVALCGSLQSDSDTRSKRGGDRKALLGP